MVRKNQILTVGLLMAFTIVTASSNSAFDKSIQNNNENNKINDQDFYQRLVIRQNNDNNNNDNKDNNKSKESDAKSSADNAKSTDAKSTDAGKTSDNSAQSSQQKTSEAASTGKSTASEAKSTDASITSESASDKSTGMPKITSSGSTGMPKLTESSSSSTNTLPTPKVTVPPMDNNPYLATSNLPEGTVFIAVGAILGGLALAVMTWRMFAAISLKRSLKRTDSTGPLMSAIDTSDGASKNMFYPGDPSRAGSAGDTLNGSVDNLARRNMPPQSLFFSPTAEVMNSANSNMNSGTGGSAAGGSMSSTLAGGGGQRSSVYLPAGYYNPGGGGGGTGSITSRTTRNFSMARESMYGGLTPSIRTSTFGGATRNASGGQFDGQQQRAPSAYLDDLLKHDAD